MSHAEVGTARLPRLLIVDDVADNRVLLVRRFTRRGYDTAEAESGEAALAVLRDEVFDAVLLDVMMPGMDGLETLQRIRQSYSPLELPVIMVTARTEPETLVDALRHQANDFLTKPIIFEIALARVASQIERKIAVEKLDSAAQALRSANDQLQARADLLARTSDEFRHLTYHDALTGLPNRRWLNERIRSAFADEAGAPMPSALLLLDLDGFKGVNDTLGHSVGDAFLQLLAGDLKAGLGLGEEIARLGGDEFAILAPANATGVDLSSLAERLIAETGRPRQIQGHEIMLGASVGIAVASSFDTPEALFRAADISMYEAKAQGRGSHRFFDLAMDRKILERQDLLRDLRGALERNELALHYQPFVNAVTHEVTGYEALLRWRHPARGMISPADFIPLAEESGLIVPIGAWVIREGCRQAARLPLGQRISVNVSPAQFRRPGLDLTVLAAVSQAGIQPSRLEIEITEAMLVDDSAATLNTIMSLKSMGVRLALDDFGVGYSSLSYLRKFPFDKLKVDRSFVRELETRADLVAIVRAICQMAEALSMTVTAEGIETPAQADTLDQVGCTELQGYLFSRPVPQAMLPLEMAGRGMAAPVSLPVAAG